MAPTTPPGPPRPPVRVRYYPRRVARPPVAEPLSPGRALRLADDPERAALALHTGEQQVFVAADPPAPEVTGPPAPRTHQAPPPVPRPGWWARLVGRLKRSH